MLRPLGRMFDGGGPPCDPDFAMRSKAAATRPRAISEYQTLSILFFCLPFRPLIFGDVRTVDGGDSRLSSCLESHDRKCQEISEKSRFRLSERCHFGVPFFKIHIRIKLVFDTEIPSKIPHSKLIRFELKY